MCAESVGRRILNPSTCGSDWDVLLVRCSMLTSRVWLSAICGVPFVEQEMVLFLWFCVFCFEKGVSGVKCRVFVWGLCCIGVVRVSNNLY